MRKRNPIKQQFFNYLVNKCFFENTTAMVYISSLNKADVFAKAAGISDCSIYDIRDLHKLESIKDELSTIDEFKILDREFHQTLGCSVRHYYNFAAQNHMFNHCWR